MAIYTVAFKDGSTVKVEADLHRAKTRKGSNCAYILFENKDGRSENYTPVATFNLDVVAYVVSEEAMVEQEGQAAADEPVEVN